MSNVVPATYKRGSSFKAWAHSTAMEGFSLRHRLRGAEMWGKELKGRIVGLALPWIATVVTALPYNRWLSRWLDRLIVVSEG